MTYPGDGEIVTFRYNSNMLPTSVSGTDTYAQTIAYDSAMRMIQLVRGANKVNSVFTYNAWNQDGGRLLNLTSTQVSTGTQLQNSTYDYDSVGNILTITDSLLGPQTQSFAYDALDRLTNSSVTGGSNGLYTEGYSYDDTTGNLASKNSVNYTAYDSNHKHAVTSLSNGNTYSYDANGNMITRHVGTQTFNLAYDAENRLVSVSGSATASFVYDGDSKQIKATVNGITAIYVGNHYEVKNSVVTKYYFAGSTRLAVRTNGTLSYLLGDHIGSSSVTTDANGVKTASALYKAFGETRYTLGNLGTDYKFTGQRLQAELGIYWFQSRWMDPSLGRFTSPDTIVPTSTQGTQAWDRYAFVNNNPVRYTDPTGHCSKEERDEGTCEEDQQATDPFWWWNDPEYLTDAAVTLDGFAFGLDVAGEAMAIVGAVIGFATGGPLGAIVGYEAGNAEAQATTNLASNVLSAASLVFTARADYLEGEQTQIGDITVPVGMDTWKSLTTFAVGLFPDTTIDLLASGTQFFINDNPYR